MTLFSHSYDNNWKYLIMFLYLASSLLVLMQIIHHRLRSSIALEVDFWAEALTNEGYDLFQYCDLQAVISFSERLGICLLPSLFTFSLFSFH